MTRPRTRLFCPLDEGYVDIRNSMAFIREDNILLNTYPKIPAALTKALGNGNFHSHVLQPAIMSTFVGATVSRSDGSRDLDCGFMIHTLISTYRYLPPLYPLGQWKMLNQTSG